MKFIVTRYILALTSDNELGMIRQKADLFRFLEFWPSSPVNFGISMCLESVDHEWLSGWSISGGPCKGLKCTRQEVEIGRWLRLGWGNPSRSSMPNRIALAHSCHLLGLPCKKARMARRSSRLHEICTRPNDRPAFELYWESKHPSVKRTYFCWWEPRCHNISTTLQAWEHAIDWWKMRAHLMVSHA